MKKSLILLLFLSPFAAFAHTEISAYASSLSAALNIDGNDNVIDKLSPIPSDFFLALQSKNGRLFVTKNKDDLENIKKDWTKNLYDPWIEFLPVSKINLKGQNLQNNDRYDLIESKKPTVFLFFPSRRWFLAKLAEHDIPARGNSPTKYLEAVFNSASFFTTMFDEIRPDLRTFRLDFRYACLGRITNEYVQGGPYIPGYRCGFNKVSYDFSDFGNLVWGSVMNWFDISLPLARAGAHTNELLKRDGFDPDADQRAIQIGHQQLAPWLFEGLDRNISIRKNYIKRYGSEPEVQGILWSQESM